MNGQLDLFAQPPIDSKTISEGDRVIVKTPSGDKPGTVTSKSSGCDVPSDKPQTKFPYPPERLQKIEQSKEEADNKKAGFPNDDYREEVAALVRKIQERSPMAYNTRTNQAGFLAQFKGQESERWPAKKYVIIKGRLYPLEGEGWKILPGKAPSNSSDA